MRPRIILCLIAILAFGASLTQGFHFDDYSVVFGPQWTAWQTRPLTWASFDLNHALSSSPVLWHAVNLAAHLAAVLLLYSVLLWLLPPRAALLAASVFAVHPIQAEAVAYVFSRATLLSTIFSLATVLFWLRNRRWLALAAFALALLAKEDCVTVPLAIVGVQALRNRTPLAHWQSIAAMLGMSCAAGLRTLLASGMYPGSGAGLHAEFSPLRYFLLEGMVIVRYLRLLLIPYGFTIDPEISGGILVALAAWVLIIALILCAASPKLRNLGGHCFLMGMVLLIPSSSIFPATDLAADHRMYLPMTAFAAGVGLLLNRLPNFVPKLIIAVLIGLSIGRMSIWASDRKLWTEAIQRAPDKLRPRIQLSRAVPPGEALEILKTAAGLYPGNPDIDSELGRTYLELNQPAMALAEFGTVLGQRPNDPHALNNRGVALRALGQERAARKDFGHALQLDSCFGEARRNLGIPICGAEATGK